MENKQSDQYGLERRLRSLDPALHKRFTDMVFVMQHTLSKFKRMFPEFTDHSVFHSLNVIDFCNQIIGPEQMECLNADEIYVLLLAAYLHDSGMAITEKDYGEFREGMDYEEYFEQRPECTAADFIRDYHHEFSGRFIEKYAEFLEIPDEETLFAVKQVSRGHRRTNLYDEKEYPSALEMRDGNTVCLPYLAALIRLADEIDVVNDRNPKLLYDIESLTDEVSVLHNRMLQAVRSMDILPDGFMLNTKADDEDVFAALEISTRKMQNTLDLCRNVTEARSDFRISQKWIRIHRI